MNDNTQPNVVVVQVTKNPGIAALLGFFFGPLGLLYSTMTGAIVMFIINVFVGVITIGFGLFITWPICAIWGYIAAQSSNKKMLAGAK